MPTLFPGVYAPEGALGYSGFGDPDEGNLVAPTFSKARTVYNPDGASDYIELSETVILSVGDSVEFTFIAPSSYTGEALRYLLSGTTTAAASTGDVTLAIDSASTNFAGIEDPYMEATLDGVVITGATTAPTDNKEHRIIYTAKAPLRLRFFGQRFNSTSRANFPIFDIVINSTNLGKLTIPVDEGTGERLRNLEGIGVNSRRKVFKGSAILNKPLLMPAGKTVSFKFRAPTVAFTSTTYLVDGGPDNVNRCNLFVSSSNLFLFRAGSTITLDGVAITNNVTPMPTDGAVHQVVMTTTGDNKFYSIGRRWGDLAGDWQESGLEIWDLVADNRSFLLDEEVTDLYLEDQGTLGTNTIREVATSAGNSQYITIPAVNMNIGDTVSLKFIAPTATLISGNYLIGSTGLDNTQRTSIRMSAGVPTNFFHLERCTATIDGNPITSGVTPYPTDGQEHTLVLTATAETMNIGRIGIHPESDLEHATFPIYDVKFNDGSVYNYPIDDGFVNDPIIRNTAGEGTDTIRTVAILNGTSQYITIPQIDLTIGDTVSIEILKAITDDDILSNSITSGAEDGLYIDTFLGNVRAFYYRGGVVSNVLSVPYNVGEPLKITLSIENSPTLTVNGISDTASDWSGVISFSYLGRRGATYRGTSAYNLKVNDGSVYNYPIDNGFIHNPAIRNNADPSGETDGTAINFTESTWREIGSAVDGLGSELYDFANVGTAQDITISQESTGFSAVSNLDNLDRVYINLTTEIGKTYLLKCDREYFAGTTNVTLSIRNGVDGNGTIYTSDDTAEPRIIFTANSTTTTLLFDAGNAPAPVTYAYSNITIRRADGYGTAVAFTALTWSEIGSDTLGLGSELWSSPIIGGGWSDNLDGSYTLNGNGSLQVISITGLTGIATALVEFEVVSITNGMKVQTSNGGRFSFSSVGTYTLPISDFGDYIGFSRDGSNVVDAVIKNVSIKRIDSCGLVQTAGNIEQGSDIDGLGSEMWNETPSTVGTYWTDEGLGVYSINSPDTSFNILENTLATEVGTAYYLSFEVVSLSGLDHVAVFAGASRLDGDSVGTHSFTFIADQSFVRFARGDGSGAFLSTIKNVTIKRLDKQARAINLQESDWATVTY